MSIKVYNTLTRKKEEYIPRDQGKASIYVCGVTPYDYAHIGNARPPVVWDCIRRFLRDQGYEVRMVQNFTDVDDKIIRRAQEKGVDPLALSREYSQVYLEDLAALGVEKVEVYPRVSEHIPEIIEMVRVLVEKGHAYELSGDVYFDIRSFSEYGKLSQRSPEEMMAGARVELNDKKKDPMDFALWKAAKPGEPSWDSPWGKGRPGWHIECSAMSLKYLQPGLDFHGGGTDLVFPHHENEIAQSEAFSGKEPFVRYWLHSAFINIGNDKMSKSLGNFVTIREACEKFTAKAVRFWILGTHYRNPLSFGEEELRAAARGLERLENARQNWQHLLTTDGIAGKSVDQAVSTEPKEGQDVEERTAEANKLKDLAEKAKKRFVEAMEDDFNTALALGVLYELVRDVNKWCLAEDFTLTPVERPALSAALSVLNHYGEVLGIWFDEAEEGGISDREIANLVEERQKARAERDFQKADQIRERLKELGIVLEDTPQGVRWKRG